MGDGDVDLNIQITQTRDSRVQNIHDELEKGDVDGYILDNGLVFRHGVRWQMQLYMSCEWEDNVLRLIHEKYGHVGIEKC